MDEVAGRVETFALKAHSRATGDVEVGERFGSLEVTKVFHRRSGAVTCNCRCSCGAVVEKTLCELKAGVDQCRVCRLAKTQPSRNLRPGDVYGQWTLVSRVRVNGREFKWLCKCTCGTTKTIAGSELISGDRTRCSRCYGDELRKRAAERRQTRLEQTA